MFSASAPLALASANPFQPLTQASPLSAGPIAVTGTVYALAALTGLPGTLSLGAARVGDLALGGTVGIGDGTTADTYQEDLVFAAGAPNDGFSLSTQAGGTIASGGGTVVGVSLATVNDGYFCFCPAVELHLHG